MSKLTPELLDQQDDDLIDTILDFQAVVKNLVQGMKSQEISISAALLQQSTNALRTLAKLLANARIQMEAQIEREEAEVGLIDGMTAEEKAALDEWEQYEAATVMGEPTDRLAKFETDDHAKLLSRWPTRET